MKNNTFKYLIGLCAVVPMLSIGELYAQKETKQDSTETVSPKQGRGVHQESDDFISVDVQPVPLKQIQPIYPEDARKKNIQGKVLLNTYVNKEGMVEKVKVMKNKTGSKELEKAAIDAVKQWTFKPAMLDDKPVAVWVAIPIQFKLAVDGKKK